MIYRILFAGDLLACQVDFGSDAVVSEQSDKHVGIGACSWLIASDGHHLIHWGGFGDVMPMWTVDAKSSIKLSKHYFNSKHYEPLNKHVK